MSVVTVTLLSEKKKIAKAYELISIDIRREVNRIPYASMVLLDGDAAQREFAMSNEEYFAPGKEIEIQVRYADKKDATLFKGPVIRHGVEANPRGSLLKVEIKDAAVKLTQTRKSMVFNDKSDSEAIADIVKAAGLKSGAVEATKPKQQQSIQYYCSDWDFIVSRAEAYGLLAVADDGEISVRKVELGAEPKHSFDWGHSEIFDFEFEVDAGHQYTAVTSRGWDIQQDQAAPAQAGAFALSQGNLNGAQLAKDVGFDTYFLSHPVSVAPEELKAWADARMMRMRMSMIRGRLSTLGISNIKLLDAMKIDGVGKRFNGRTLITGIGHRVDADGWRTDIQFGLSARSFSVEDGIKEAPAAGLLPGVGGLQIGVVNKIEEDPDKKSRIKVTLPGIDPKTGSVWARVASPDAGSNRGYFFCPEVGDEVVVGFFNEDPRQPVILGALSSSKNALPDEFAKITAENLKKGIITKAGTKIIFNDDKKASLYFETASKNKILLDDENKLITISDQHGNKIIMDQNGIQLESVQDLKLTAKGNVEIKGGKVDVK